MGLLISKLFTTPTEDSKLEACLVSDAAHITPGAQGEHVKKIQTALNQLSRGPGRENFNLEIDGLYGPKTSAAVKAYKDNPSRRILQPWQTSADNIVGKRTIKSLDDEMDILENETSVGSKFVSTTPLGAPHDHTKCPGRPIASSPGRDGRAQHVGTPINPQGFKRKINIGGEGETNYLGFQDFVTKTNIFNGPPPRPFTETLEEKCASDICMRSTPIDRQIRREINRIAISGCRLTVASPPQFLIRPTPFILSLGALLEDITIFDVQDPKDSGIRVFVIAMRGDGRFIDA